MRSFLYRRLFLIVILLIGSWRIATATHAIGSDLTYTYIEGSSSQYRVVARLYGRQPGIVPDFGDIISLQCNLNGCASPASGSFITRLNRTSLVARQLGCAGNQSYRISQFEGVVTLPPGQWTLTVNSENRPSASNLGNGNGDFYTLHLSAFLDNSSGLTNSSPRFTSLTLPYVCASQPYHYSFSTFEPDGDSLVYRSVEPLTGNILPTPTGCPFPAPYSSYPGGQFQDPINGQTAAYPAGQFSTSLPLLSFRASNGMAMPQFELNAATGDLLTTPVLQVGYNVVAVRVDEYRRVNGIWTQIGSVTRDVIYSLFNGDGNRNPSITSLTVAGASASQPIDQAIMVQPGQLVSLTLTAADQDAGQALRLSSDVAAIIPGASFQTQGANQGVLSWQVPTTIQPGRYAFTVTVADNGCPVNGSEVRTISFVIPARTLATSSSRALVLAAYPMPFTERVQFQLPVAAVQSVTITDGLGRTVATLTSQPDGSVQWRPAASIAAGAYFARSTDGKHVFRLLRE